MKDETFHYYEEPRFAKWLFGSPNAGWLWLATRLFLGGYWIMFGWRKVFGAGSDWMTTGTSLQTYLNSRIDPTEPAVYFGWYGDFVGWMADNAAIWAKIIAVGELTIGLGLVLGAFTGIVAFFGLLLNANIVMAAFDGPGALFIALEIVLMLAWRNAGYYGLDRFLLPWIGTPDEPGTLFTHERSTADRPLAGIRA
jgi:thiosulfate dehydrogenase [quinone] large subunit